MAGNNVKVEGGADSINRVDPVNPVVKEEGVGIEPTGPMRLFANPRVKKTCLSVLLVAKVLFVTIVVIMGFTMAYQLMSGTSHQRPHAVPSSFSLG